ncbi:sedoheptulose 7-phosphate cyclase [Micromonospora sp. WMMD1120]|uniref:sedoheptulose 7-phosphate cyclase n=1 Tax=Micromonospora sp. WMMD1120 TaxID=3016106 RepID=UPI00241741B4|nr:sedoheptulose 7-phosphate cyclase [Micromonospora sp. WMMD1120]MDG4810776.1 sedoheptulose 7-phosphate cyclase [Micromonospora sp. WMMD1120]
MRPTKTYHVRAQLSADYEVVRTDNILDLASEELVNQGRQPGNHAQRRFIVLDQAVDAIYGKSIRAYFDHHRVECRFLVLPGGEHRKVMDSVVAVATALDSFGIDRRREPVISIGGGVLLDLVGVATALYRRGVPHLRVPTTLIGLVDASIGVKTGINHGDHKNRLGTFQPPTAVLLDRRFLASLPERHLRNGVAEMIKLAIVRDERLFELLEEDGDRLVEERFQGRSPAGERVASEVLHRSVEGMLAELEPNLWERHLDRLVDFGHSVGPTIEMLAGGDLLHGESVAIDMAMFTTVAARRGLLHDKDARRILELLHRFALPVDHALLDDDVVRRAMADTVRHRDGRQRLPVPVGIGRAVVLNDVTQDELRSALRHNRAEGVR